MLGELRTVALSPQKYYELYMQVWSELRHLEMFFGDRARHGKSNLEMYELVQHAGNILPRLYLLITVGSVYVKSKEGAAKDVLKDLVEMTKGVQQPIHGLFLRAYLSQCSKTLLPDTGSEYEGQGGDVRDAVDFVLQNFTEMNKLWVRMQHGGPQRDRERRERERRELRDLVGKNLLVLTQLEGMDLALYDEVVLPRILEQVVNCKDEIAQPYLMDAIVQVFPDEFHIRTLQKLLDACPLLKPSVRVGDVLAALADRLAKAAKESPEIVEQFAEVDAFGKLAKCVEAVIAAQPTMEANDRLLMHAALMSFATAAHGDRLDYVDGVLSSCADALGAPGGAKRAEEAAGAGETKGKEEEVEEGGGGDAWGAGPGPGPGPGGSPPPPMIVSDAKGVRQLVALLTVPLDAYDVVSVLGLASYPRAMSLLQPSDARAMAVTIARSVLRSDQRVSEARHAETLFRFISCLVRDPPGGLAPEDEPDDEDFEEEQNLVARLVHCLRSEDSDTQYRLLVVARKQFGAGGPRRLVKTLPPLAFEALRLGADVTRAAAADLRLEAEREGEEANAAPLEGAALSAAIAAGPVGPAINKLLQFLHQTIAALADVGAHETALRLFLESASLADAAGAEPIAYAFFERAMTIYEDEISDSAEQRSAHAILVGTLQRCVALTPESRDALTHKAVTYGARLLKKPDQARAAARCAHLFWGPEGVDGAARDAEAVASCLKKSLKIANAAHRAAATTGAGVGEAVRLYVLALNEYLWFFDRGCETVTAETVRGLVEVIQAELGGEEACGPDVEAYYAATIRHIKRKKLEGGEVGARYEAIDV